jgi:hypothetical protein
MKWIKENTLYKKGNWVTITKWKGEKYIKVQVQLK